MLFTVELGDETIQAEGFSHESALTAYLMKRRRTLLSARDPLKVDKLFETLPKKAVVSGGGISKSYRVKWEKVGGRKSTFPGTRYVFSVEDPRLDRFVRVLRGS